jgi:hypothetical protein
MDASEQVDKKIAALSDWRGRTMARLRTLINKADPKLCEGFKWNTAVWSARSNVCVLGAFTDHIKINFFKGASLADTHHLFNAGP